MRLHVAGGHVGARLDRDLGKLTLWVDRDDRTTRSAGGVALDLPELEALIWQLANLRNHMALRNHNPPGPPGPARVKKAPGPPARKAKLSSSHRSPR